MCDRAPRTWRFAARSRPQAVELDLERAPEGARDVDLGEHDLGEHDPGEDELGEAAGA